MDSYDTFSLIFSLVAIVVSASISLIIYFGQRKLTLLVHKGQCNLSQRQLIIPLWTYLSSIREINPQNPSIPDVISLVNTLELVALCCEGGMVDELVIRSTFKSSFLHHYRNIKKINQKMAGLNKDGEEILLENKAATRLFKIYEQEEENIGKLN